MGPYEFAALLIVLPLVFGIIGLWRLFETDGAPSPEFEAWCRQARPVVFALRCAPGRVPSVAAVVAIALGRRLEAEHHRGRYPWTRYLFVLALEVDPVNDVLVGRVHSCAMRRGVRRRPEIGATLDRLTTALADSLAELWVHAELRDDDDVANRNERGWVASIEGGAAGSFAPTAGLPGWARMPTQALA
jgi:hypothetical protein